MVRAQHETLGDLEAWMLNSPQPWTMFQIKAALLKLMGALTNPVNNYQDFHVGTGDKNVPANAGGMGLISGLGRFPMLRSN